MAEEDAHSLYRSISTAELRELRAAYLLDLERATRPGSLAFVRSRLALIADILQDREATGA